MINSINSIKYFKLATASREDSRPVPAILLFLWRFPDISVVKVMIYFIKETGYIKLDDWVGILGIKTLFYYKRL